ncbi:hypothetical protein [Xanthomonas maliensis]|uniref:hypothetical protein n=1 Tax=Xanthomonas maliensis TaxID=1321368 RepID=UPI001264C1D2|nr:hypothetical protein [Xanthomonas maliensis]KAB7766494.1 hypothetical protein CKY51_13160 [Xanthomonas maliensis]
MIPPWFQDLLPIALCGGIGYCIGMLRDAQSKLDRMQMQIEQLQAQLQDRHALEHRRTEQ